MLLQTTAARFDAPPRMKLDDAALNQLRELDPRGQGGLVARVLNTYDASLTRMLPELVTASLAQELETVRLLAHTLRSSSAAIGASALARQCADIERMAHERRTASLAASIDALLIEAERVRSALQQVPERAA